MPFITEEIFHQLKDRKDDLTISQLADAKLTDPVVLESGSLLKEMITSLRDVRNRQQLKPKDAIKLHIFSKDRPRLEIIQALLQKQVNASTLSYTTQNVPDAAQVVIQNVKIFLESNSSSGNLEQKAQLEKEMEYLRGFLMTVEKKLSNERFVQNAKPEVLAIERKKKADAEAKIRAIEESLSNS
jgi:valyl-tRNA synthetase